ncbi:hypothetical protein [Streptomyces niveus]
MTPAVLTDALLQGSRTGSHYSWPLEGADPLHFHIKKTGLACSIPLARLSDFCLISLAARRKKEAGDEFMA